MLFIRLLSLFIFINFLSLYVPTIATANFDTFTIDSSPYGIPYNKWLEKWWSWWISLPLDKHPYYDPSDPERCSTMQKGPIWFLPDITPGKKLDYNCTIPQGKGILIPISVTFCEKAIKGTCGTLLTDDELIKSANNIRTFIEHMDIEIDNIKIPLNGLTIKTSLFNVTVPDPPPIEIWNGLMTGTYKTAATGYFLIVHNIPPGEHTIKLKVLDLLAGNEGPPPKFEPLRTGTYKIFIQ
jgi:hypothetical protein